MTNGHASSLQPCLWQQWIGNKSLPAGYIYYGTAMQWNPRQLKANEEAFQFPHLCIYYHLCKKKCISIIFLVCVSSYYAGILLAGRTRIDHCSCLGEGDWGQAGEEDSLFIAYPLEWFKFCTLWMYYPLTNEILWLTFSMVSGNGFINILKHSL